jgi:hypothetical protein
MALITDPDSLTDGQEIIIDTTAKTIALVVVDALSTDGVTIKCVYSKLKELWKNNAIYIKFPFPMTPITDEQFEMVNDWDWADTTTRNLLRTGGWAVKDLSGNSLEEWAGIISLGSLGGADQVYYQQGVGEAAVNIVLPGAVNQAVKVFDSTVAKATVSRARNGSNVATIITNGAHGLIAGNYVVVSGVGGTGYNGSYVVLAAADGTTITYANTGTLETTEADTGGTVTTDHRRYFKVFCREWQKSYAFSQLSDIGVSTFTYQAYRFPLANGSDVKVTHTENAVNTTTPYTDMSITWYAAAQTETGFTGGDALFHVIVDGASGTAEEIYEFVQAELRKATDIDAGAGSQIGKVTNSILRFVGDTLYTSLMPEGGTFVDNYLAVDKNRIVFVEDDGDERIYPYVAVLILNFGDNLKNDAAAKYWVYFTTTPDGDDYGEATAILVNDGEAVPAAMTGDVSNNASISRTFDYDGNTQGGRTISPPGNVGVTAVAIGLSTGQFVKATGTIAKSKANSVSLVAPLERNYSNPA